MSRLMMISDILIGYNNTIWVVMVPGGVFTDLNPFLRHVRVSFKCSCIAKIPVNIWIEGGGSKQHHPHMCKTITTTLTTDIQPQFCSTAPFLIKGIAPVGARVWPTDGGDGKQGRKLITHGTGQDVWCEGLVRFLHRNGQRDTSCISWWCAHFPKMWLRFLKTTNLPTNKI